MCPTDLKMIITEYKSFTVNFIIIRGSYLAMLQAMEASASLNDKNDHPLDIT